MNNLADPSNPAYDEALLAAMNAKLTALIETELEDRSLVALSS